jgi:uncharacterized protein
MIVLKMEKSFVCTKIAFNSSGEICRGYLYVPTGVAKTKQPCVVMANGFSGTMDWILPSFAEAFSSQGIATLIFDYRHLGESDGIPRQIIDPDEQLTDLKNAIGFARKHEMLDGNRIALWGTSLGGSYVFKIAAEDSRIAAVIGNMPAIDAIKGANVELKMKKVGATKFQLLATSLRLVTAAAFDYIKGVLSLEPFYLKVYGKPGKAFFADPSLAHLFDHVEKQGPTWQNKVAARFLFKAPRYTEGTFERIKAPILLSLATDDVEVSGDFVKAKAKGATTLQVKEYPFGHFDLYHGDALKKVLADQVGFLTKAFTSD